MLQINNTGLVQAAFKTSDGSITLKPNQLLLAKVLELFPDQTATILYNNIPIHAKLEAALTKGERYLFEVTAANEESVVLKKVNSETSGPTNKQILQKFSLPESEPFLKAVDYVLSEKRSLTKEMVKNVATLLEQTSELPLQTKKEVISKLLDHKLPVTPEVVKAVTSSVALNKTGSLLEMKQLFDGLVPLVKNQPAIEKTVRLMENLFGFSFTNKKEGNTILYGSATRQGELLNSKKSLSENPAKPMDLQSESELQKQSKAIQVNTQGNESKKEAQTINPSRETNVKPKEPSEMFIEAAKNWLKKSGLLHEQGIIRNPVLLKQTETLKGDLIYLQKHGATLGLSHETMQRVEQAINKITSQQIQNLPVDDQVQQFTLHIPLPHSELPKEIHVQWEGKKAKGEPIDKNHCRMLFWLEMEHLKQVAVDVQIQNRILSVKIFSEYPEIEKMASPFLKGLKKVLFDKNYHLSSVSFSQDQQKEMPRPNPQFQYKGMDIRV